MATPTNEFSMTSTKTQEDSTEESEPSDNQTSSESENIGVDTEVDTKGQTPFTGEELDLSGIFTDIDMNTFLLVVLIIIEIGERL